MKRLAGERFDVVVREVFHDIAVAYRLVTVPGSATRQTVWKWNRSG